MYDEPFMEYSICYESWINYVNDGGFNAKGISNTKSLLGFWTIGMREKDHDAGGG